ncbi:hypothetical protein [Cellulomonas sp. URHD0024]|nr:hypothetical protein [Cellulomonas sp. URHD0024]
MVSGHATGLVRIPVAVLDYEGVRFFAASEEAVTRGQQRVTDQDDRGAHP